MPIYEYRCGACKRKVSIFFPSINAAESRAASGQVNCPLCGSADLTRLMSRFNAIRSDDAGAGDMADFPDDPDSLMAGVDESDPRSLARWARRMKESMGDELDVGPEFDQALARIESGEDPDKVMDDIGPEALGGAADEDDFGDMDADGDFGGD